MAPPRSSRPTRPSQNRRGSSSARSRDSASLRRSDARSSPLSSSSSSAAALRSDDVDSATTSSRPHPQHDAGVSSGRVNRSSSSRRSGEAAGLSMRGDEMDEESRAAAEIARVAQLRGHRVSGLSRLAALQDEDEDEEEDDDALEERGRRHPHRHGGSDGEGDGEEEDEEADGTGPDTEDDDQGEDLMENLVADYQEMLEPDTYESSGIDEAEYEELTVAQRRAAESIIARREREAQRTRSRGRRRPAALATSDDTSTDGLPPGLGIGPGGSDSGPSGSGISSQVSGSGTIASSDGDISGDQYSIDEADAELDFNVRGPLREYIITERPRRAIHVQFRRFLEQYQTESGAYLYIRRIQSMAAANRQSFEVSYPHLSTLQPVLAMWLADAPTEMLQIFDAAGTEVVNRLFPNYSSISPEIHVRITDLPITDSLRDIRQVHLNGLIRVHGVVTRRTAVFPQLRMVKFDCLKCGYVIGPLPQTSSEEVKVGACPNCQSRGPFSINMEQTIYRNYQKITLQEAPGSVPPGRLPRAKDVILHSDLIDIARPGEEIEITGIYKNTYDIALNSKQGFPVFATVIEANHVGKKADAFSSFSLTEEDRQAIVDLSQDDHIGEKIIRSFAPSIYGHEDVKIAIALALFGGVGKDIAGKHRIRGDINVLLLGDPGTAKSQFLKYIEKTAHRAVFTTGKGSTAVGLTASVHRDPITREWTLEGGALVLADNGVCLIDEFDKMGDQDRTSIHEAMEQQSISIAKAGIVTTLQARCSVIAAANPNRGRYDPSLTFKQNVELSDPILSRFDILCVIRDVVDPVTDERLADFVVGSHIRSHPDYEADGDASAPSSSFHSSEDIIPKDLLKKYIVYAKQNCTPKLHQMDENRISSLYAELRRESSVGGGIPITVRHVESMIRMAEAHARMHLREYVHRTDVDMAIRVMLESFISSQKFQVKKTLEKRFRQYVYFRRDSNELLLHLLQSMVREVLDYRLSLGEDLAQISEITIEMSDFSRRARQFEIMDVRGILQSDILSRAGFSYNDSSRLLTRAFN